MATVPCPIFEHTPFGQPTDALFCAQESKVLKKPPLLPMALKHRY